jgi:hypothetical protein
MYSKRNRLKRKKKDLSFGISAPVNTPLGIGLLAAPVVIPLIARVISSVYNKIRAHMNNRELMRQIQDGRLTERDLVQSFVNQFFSELPSKYVDLYRKQLRRLQTCNTFRELKRTYKEIGFANTVGMNTITKLESDYLRAVANRPKSISVNGYMASDSKPKRDRRKRNDLNPILSDAIKLAFTLALAAAAISVKYYLERQSIVDEIREGNLTETDLVQRFVKDFYLQLPSKYIYVAKQNLKQLQSCRTFRELRRTFNRIGFSNTEGLKQISLLEAAYQKYLSEEPKKIGVNGVITHDSMPWAHIKFV